MRQREEDNQVVSELQNWQNGKAEMGLSLLAQRVTCIFFGENMMSDKHDAKIIISEGIKTVWPKEQCDFFLLLLPLFTFLFFISF